MRYRRWWCFAISRLHRAKYSSPNQQSLFIVRCRVFSILYRCRLAALSILVLRPGQMICKGSGCFAGLLCVAAYTYVVRFYCWNARGDGLLHMLRYFAAGRLAFYSFDCFDLRGIRPRRSCCVSFATGECSVAAISWVTHATTYSL